MVMRASHGDLGVDEHPIGDGLWQRVLEALQREPYMHLRDHPPLRWTRVTAYAAAASCSLLIGVM